MDTTTNARLEQYVEVYERLNTVVKSTEVTAAIIEQVGKDTRCEWLMNARSNGNGNGRSNGNDDEPATEKQIGFLKRLNVDVPTGVNKQEASRLIDEAQANAA